MRDADHISVGANPIMPVRVDKALISGTAKSDNAADTLSRLARVRDEKHTSAFERPGSSQMLEAGGDGKSESMSFADFIDIITPLQHIPGVSTLYREITGDEISDAAKVAGNTLFLGPVGAVTAMIDVAVDNLTGSDIGEHVLSLFGDDEPSETVADASTNASTNASAATAQQTSPQATSSSFESASGQILSAAEPFFFGSENAATPGADTGAIPAAPVAGFAGAPEPVDLESLPADILAALYSGQAGGQAGGQVGQSQVTQPQPANAFASNDQLAMQEQAPRWSLFTGTEGNANAQAATQAYGADPLGQMNEIMNEPGTIGYQGGWFSTVMPDIVSRYEHSAALQRQNQPIVDIQQ
ncbi:MAG: hypothetical protein HOE65_11940 [Rhodospirillales bacterium]|nr:hypothetical protein [Rhodospirillales bacterium]